MEKLRPNEQRSKNAIVLIWIVFGLQILMLISHYLQYNLLQKAANGMEVSSQSVLINSIREITFSVLYLIAYIISGITFIQWFRRAYFNLHIKRSTPFLYRGMGCRLLVCAICKPF